MEEIYFSVDTEASGPVPSLYSMLSVGACVVGDEGQTFYRELRPLHTSFVKEAIAVPIFSERVMLKAGKDEQLLGREIAVMSALQEFGDDPGLVMKDFAHWVQTIAKGKNPLLVAFNAPFDWSFINYYFHFYGIENPFGITAIDVGAYYFGMMKCSWMDLRISPEFYPTTRRNTHHALDDAMAQAESFGKMLRYNQIPK